MLLPVFPAALVTPVMFKATTLVASVTEIVGVKVAVQTVPPSVLPTAVKVPLAMVRSSLVNPVTASLKVNVTKDVSPARSAASETTMPTVGCTVLMV